MKKFLLAMLLFFAALPLGTSALSVANAKMVNTKVFENQTINYAAPCYYDADYWYQGQRAGYMFVLDLTGDVPHQATWELNVSVRATNKWGVHFWKQFTFNVVGCGYIYHTHILEMQDQINPGEYIDDNPEVRINHFWVVS